MDDAMIEKVLKAKAPKVSVVHGDDRYILTLDDEVLEIGPEDADLLFRSMFFRGNNY